MTTKVEQSQSTKLDIIEKIAKTVSFIAIPIVIAIIGWLFQDRLKEKDVSKEYVEMAISILTKADQSEVDPDIRAWAVELLNHNSPTKFSPEVTRRLKTGELNLGFALEATLSASMSSELALAPDGRIIAIGQENGSILLWDSATDTILSEIPGHLDRVTSVAFTPDSKYLVSGSMDNTIRIWDLSEKRIMAVLHGHTDVVLGVVVSPDGSTIISLSLDRTIKQWDIQTGRQLSVLRLPDL